MIGRQVESRWRTSKVFLPVGKLGIHDAVVEPVTMPDRVVGILHGERWQRGGGTAGFGFVQGGEISEQHAPRPAVRGDVMEDDEENVVVLGEAYERSSEHWAPLEVERTPRLLP